MQQNHLDEHLQTVTRSNYSFQWHDVKKVCFAAFISKEVKGHYHHNKPMNFPASLSQFTFFFFWYSETKN